MFRLILFICMLRLSIGGIIRGRVLLDGDVKKSLRVPAGASLTVSLQDTSLADAPAKVIQQSKLSSLFAFPLAYQIELPRTLPSAISYSLSARITKGETLFFINDQYIPVTIGVDSPIMIDIPVIDINQGVTDQPSLADIEQLSWPKMVGKEGIYAVQYIKEKSGLENVFTVLENSPITMDYRTDRVRVFTNEQDIVTQIPRTG